MHNIVHVRILTAVLIELGAYLHHSSQFYCVKESMSYSLLVLALATVLVANYSQAVSVGQHEEKVLIAIHDKFQCCFENDRGEKESPTQYAVLYWGDDNDIGTIDLDDCRNERKNGIFWVKPDYSFQPKSLSTNCMFLAGKVEDNRKHTEKSILWSFRKEGGKYTKCPTAPKDKDGNLQSIYMFTHNSPCTPKKDAQDKHEKSCTTKISVFAEQCKAHFKYLYIGYVKDYSDAKLAEERINAIENAAIKKIGVKEIDCKNSKVCQKNKKIEL